MMTTKFGTRGAGTLVATSLGLFMIFLDASIVNVALPDIQEEFQVGEAGVQWVVAAYSLTMAMFIMAAASFGDMRGRRLSYVTGLVVFSVASAACGLAPNLVVLAAARGVQGVGAAIVNVASLALVTAAFQDPGQRARAIGIWTGIAAVALGLGPTVGGFLTEEVGWRSTFAFNPIVGVLAIVLTMVFVQESQDPADRGFDMPGQLLFIVAVGAFTFALIAAPNRGWTSPIILTGFALAAIGLLLFIRTERRSAQPMMDLQLFRSPQYSAAIYAVFATLFCAYGMLLVITQYFQNVRDFSPIEAGLLMLAFSVPSMILAPLAGRIVARVGGRRPTLVGLALVTAGMAVLAASGGTYLAVTLAGLVLIGTGVGLAVASATSVAMSDIPQGRAGMAAGILSAQRALGSTAGYAMLGTVLAAGVAVLLPARLEPVIPDAETRDQVVSEIVASANPQAFIGVGGPGNASGDGSGKDDEEILAAADTAFVGGIRLAMLAGVFVGGSAWLVAWFAFPRTSRNRPAVPTSESGAAMRPDP